MELLHKDVTGKILGAAMEVHKELGCGFLEASKTPAIDLKNPRNPRFQRA
jgi:hypothetical protein